MPLIAAASPRAVLPRGVQPALLLGLLLASQVAAQHHIFTFDGDSALHFFGHAVSGAGDVNKDGFPDLVVGVPYDGKNGTLAGSARVLSGRDGKVLFAFYGGSAFDWFGYSVSGAGDVNRDGYADVIVGAPSGTVPFNSYATVFSGRDGKALYTFSQSWSYLGHSVAGAGDVNRDGYADVLVGTRDVRGQPSNAKVFSGRDGKLLHTFTADAFGDQFGSSVAAAGDVNKDGYPDFIVGAPENLSTRFPGYARVFSGRDGKSLYRVKGDSAGDEFGWSVAGAGDVNKDGYADFIVGARYDDNSGQDSGSARVFSGVDGKVLYTFDGDAAYDQLGFSVAGAGDVDQDGHADLLVGMPYASYGGARVLSGKTGKVLQTFKGDAAFDRFGWSVASVGDMNRDGYVDLVVGAPYDDNNGGASGSARVLSSVKLALTTDRHFLSLAKGGTQAFHLDGGPARKGRIYLLAGTFAGTQPGIKLGTVTLPLNPDPYTSLLISNPNSVITNSFGRLDSGGKSTARLKLPPGLSPGLAGSVVHHAFVVVTESPFAFDLASNATPLTLVK